MWKHLWSGFLLFGCGLLVPVKRGRNTTANNYTVGDGVLSTSLSGVSCLHDKASSLSFPVWGENNLIDLHRTLTYVGVLTIMLCFFSSTKQLLSDIWYIASGRVSHLVLLWIFNCIPRASALCLHLTHRDGFSFLSAASQWAAEWVFIRPSSMRSHGHCI